MEVNREVVVGDVGDKLPGKPDLAEFVKLLPGVSGETLLLSYCKVLNNHYQAVTSYYSAVAELAKERSVAVSSAVSSAEQSAVDTVSSKASSGSGSVSVGSSASTGKQARRARRRLQKSRKLRPTDAKALLMSSTDWRSRPAAVVSGVSSVRSSTLSACPDESRAESVMRRKHDAVVARGQGFCYLYAIDDCVMEQVADELGPNPLFSDLLAQSVERFESVGCLAALRVDVSSGNGHVVSSVRSGLTRLWTLCCSADWRDYAVGSLGFSTKGYLTCGATFVRDTDFRLGASLFAQAKPGSKSGENYKSGDRKVQNQVGLVKSAKAALFAAKAGSGDRVGGTESDDIRDFVDQAMKRKRAVVENLGPGFCYLYAVRDDAMTQMARDLGPDPLLLGLLDQPAVRFESISFLAALPVDVSFDKGHVVFREGGQFVSLWKLCCSIERREYAIGALGRLVERDGLCEVMGACSSSFRLGTENYEKTRDADDRERKVREDGPMGGGKYSKYNKCQQCGIEYLYGSNHLCSVIKCDKCGETFQRFSQRDNHQFGGCSGK